MLPCVSGLETQGKKKVGRFAKLLLFTATYKKIAEVYLIDR